jgi:hypothetical protein
MGHGVNLPELSWNVELFFKEKICEPSSQDGEPGGASVHGGLVAVAPREARWRRLGKKWGSSKGSSPRALVASSTARQGWRR